MNETGQRACVEREESRDGTWEIHAGRGRVMMPEKEQ